MRPQSLRLCGRQRREDPDQHAARRFEMGRPHPRPRLRAQLRLDHCDEGAERVARAGLRLRRAVLWRPDLATRELNDRALLDESPAMLAGLFAGMPVVEARIFALFSTAPNAMFTRCSDGGPPTLKPSALGLGRSVVTSRRLWLALSLVSALTLTITPVNAQIQPT